jgi:hypothetical protein
MASEEDRSATMQKNHDKRTGAAVGFARRERKRAREIIHLEEIGRDVAVQVDPSLAKRNDYDLRTWLIGAMEGVTKRQRSRKNGGKQRNDEDRVSMEGIYIWSKTYSIDQNLNLVHNRIK